jgi:hypothetical protein
MGKRCPARSFTKRDAKGTVVLKPFLRRPITTAEGEEARPLRAVAPVCLDIRS